MSQIFRGAGLLIFVVFSLVPHAFAQKEEINLSTYYPSPYGVYTSLRLFPGEGAASGESCQNEGELRFSAGESKVLVCKNLKGGLKWGHLDDVWDVSGDSVFLSSDGQSIGIGTNNPGGLLEIKDGSARAIWKRSQGNFGADVYSKMGTEAAADTCNGDRLNRYVCGPAERKRCVDCAGGRDAAGRSDCSWGVYEVVCKEEYRVMPLFEDEIYEP
ncbi:MAG: hypothetical protein COV72_04930 [Candidatus Omnitrophica bacterium CG11_big_fil_rev_8_21_14_0_20_42_13]|uniref:Uncharacterized protein n=1 Tax=Candidatus Ghiorseimicrobium undicola TaxID=1974746 RepID=A0A2H0LZI7_9BACT|nr:MAG: hypothetical protein COV72_04930 [Candidatus Omnitrophica bacterium CG11_big_fil_rev_8_21_14_0_20_42_13]